MEGVEKVVRFQRRVERRGRCGRRAGSTGRAGRCGRGRRQGGGCVRFLRARMGPRARWGAVQRSSDRRTCRCHGPGCRTQGSGPPLSATHATGAHGWRPHFRGAAHPLSGCGPRASGPALRKSFGAPFGGYVQGANSVLHHSTLRPLWSARLHSLSSRLPLERLRV